MNRVTVVLVAVAAAVTLAVTTLLTASHSSSLPVPHVPAVAAVTHSGSTGGGTHPGSNGSSGGGSPRSTQQGYTPGPAPTLTSCTVSVSNPSPSQGQTAETVTVSSTPDVLVTVVANYVHTRSRHGGVTGPTGSVSFSLPVAHAPVGVAVGVSATASLRSQKVTCATSFTPVP
jgi:hypothetical protein